MPKIKPPGEERALIVQHPDKRPYGARARIHLQTAASIGNTEGVSLLLDSGTVVTIQPARKVPWEGGDKFSLTLVGFPTATSAEVGGRRLVQALLWTAVSMNFALRLEYATYEPTAVFNRTHLGGIQAEGFGTVGWPIDRVLDELRQSYAELGEPNQAVLLSMEIFAGAGLEVSQRARFLAIVSALEPLSEDRSLGPEASNFVDSCVERLDNDPSIPASVRASIRGRLQHLRTESIRQGILRVIRENLSGTVGAPGLIDEAYAVRSQIVHGGRSDDPDLDLEDFGRNVGAMLRELYSAKLKRVLYGAG